MGCLNIAKFCCIQSEMHHKEIYHQNCMCLVLFQLKQSIQNLQNQWHLYMYMFQNRIAKKNAPTEKISHTMPFSPVICEVF